MEGKNDNQRETETPYSILNPIFVFSGWSQRICHNLTDTSIKVRESHKSPGLFDTLVKIIKRSSRFKGNINKTRKQFKTSWVSNCVKISI